MPEKEFAKKGGTLHGFQLWVNLPGRDKMMQPRYQDVPSAKIPTAQKDGVKVRVIAGESLGARAVIDTRTPIMYLHFELKAGEQVSQPVPAVYNVFAYVVKGDGVLSGRQARRGQVALFERDGDTVSIEAKSDMDVLLIGGVPLGEPVVRYGPFVMNTKDEIYQAIEDYRSGRM